MLPESIRRSIKPLFDGLSSVFIASFVMFDVSLGKGKPKELLGGAREPDGPEKARCVSVQGLLG